MYQSGKYTFECSDFNNNKKFRITLNASGEQDGRTRATTLANQSGGWNLSTLILVSYEESSSSTSGYIPTNSTGYSTEQWLQRLESQIINTNSTLREINDRSKVAKF